MHVPFSRDRVEVSEMCKVAMFPDWRRNNPYMDAVAGGVEDFGYTVSFPDIRLSTMIIKAAKGDRETLPDLLHLHWQHPYIHSSSYIRSIVKSVSFLIKVALLRIFGVPIVWTVHNVVDHERSAPGLEHVVGSILARLVSRLTVHCCKAKEEVAEAYRLSQRTRRNIRVVAHPNYYGSYPSAVCSEQAREELGIPENQYVYLHFGSMRPYKRLGFMARNFIELNDRDVMFLIAGWVGDEQVFDSLSKVAQGRGDVVVAGRRIPEAEVAMYFSAADAFLYGADRILMSGSVMLALTYGLPIVAPRVGCLPEVVPDRGGVWYTPDDDRSFQGALGEVQHVPRSDVEPLNRSRANEFMPSRVGAELASVYRSVTT